MSSRLLSLIMFALPLLVLGAEKFRLDFDNHVLQGLSAGKTLSGQRFGEPAFVAGKCGGGLQFMRGQRLEFPLGGLLSSVSGTVECFFKLGAGAVQEPRHLLTFFRAEGERFYLRVLPGGVLHVFVRHDGVSDAISGSGDGLVAEDWNHVALVWERRGGKTVLGLYVNGMLLREKLSGALVPDFRCGGTLVVGAYADGKLSLSGSLDEVRICDVRRYRGEEIPDLLLRRPAHELLGGLEALGKVPAELEGVAVALQRDVAALQEINDVKLYRSRYQQLKRQLAELSEQVQRIGFGKRLSGTKIPVYVVSAMKKCAPLWKSLQNLTDEPFVLAGAGGEVLNFQVLLPNVCDGEERVRVELIPGDGSPCLPLKLFKVDWFHSRQASYADKLIPVGQDIVLPEEAMTVLWGEVRVPAGTPGGQFDYVLRATREDCAGTASISVRIWRFNLPVKPRLQTAFGMRPTWLAQHLKTATEQELEQMNQIYLRNMLDHKVSPKSLISPYESWHCGDAEFLAPRLIRMKNQDWKLDFTDYDRQLDYLLPLGLNSIMVGHRLWEGGTYGRFKTKTRCIPYVDQATGGRKWLAVDPEGEEAKALSQFLIHEWYGHLQRRGLADLAYSYIYDEPMPDEISKISLWTAWIREVAPELKNLITSRPLEHCLDVDIWCPLTEHLAGRESQKALKTGKRLWGYVCCAPLSPSPNFFLHQTAVQNRLPLWMSYRFGATGFLYYETARSLVADIEAYPGWDFMPGSEGDGFLVYPGREGPVNSVRFELVRLGIQDVEYFLMLEDLAGKLQAGHPLVQEASRLKGRLEKLIAGPQTYERKWQPYEQYRRDSGALIEKLVNAEKH